MAIQKRFIHFKKFSDFNSKKLSANEANTQYTIGVSGEVQTGAPDILYQSYCWIKDTKQQWTHAQLYDCSGGSGDVDLSEYLTAEEIAEIYATIESLDGKQDTLVSGTNIKTINGKSLLGSGNTIISGYEWKVVVNAGQTWSLAVDYKFMIANTLNGPLTIQLPTTNPTSDNYTKECGITFTTGSTAPTITFNGNIWWVNGTAPTIDANCVYEFSFKFNFANNTWLGVYASFKTA